MTTYAQLEVLWTVIRAVAVDVMDGLVWMKAAANSRLDNKVMFPSVAPAICRPNVDVSLLVDLFAAAHAAHSEQHAGSAAELVIVAARLERGLAPLAWTRRPMPRHICLRATHLGRARTLARAELRLLAQHVALWAHILCPAIATGQLDTRALFTQADVPISPMS